MQPFDHQQRRTDVRNKLNQEELDAMVIPVSTDLQYLTGLNLKKTERPILLVIHRSGEAVLVCPAFESERIASQADDLTLLVYEEDDDPFSVFAHLLATATRIAISERAWFAEFWGLRAIAPSAEIVGGGAIMEPLRWNKHVDELLRIRHSIATWHQVLERALAQTEHGVRASSLRDLIIHDLVEAGGRAPSCTVTVGPSTALPHGGADLPIAHGETLLIDGGVAFDGYRSDITRTYFVGEPSDKHRDVLAAVLAAQSAAIDALRPGISAEAVDRTARSVIEDAGYGPFFTHRLGHGLGMDGHEPPYLVAGNKQTLQVGMVVTIEPGVYLPGEFGVRIEDDVLITTTGAKCLSERVQSIDALIL